MIESELRSRVSDAFGALYSNLQRAAFVGWEFDDALASPVVRAMARDNLLAQRVAIQVVRRSSVNLRPMLRTPRLESTKARGFIARGLLYAHRADGGSHWLAEARRHLDWLLDHRSAGVPGFGWGNAFDFASRGGFYPAGLPTVVWSSLIGESFLQAHQVTGDSRYLDAVHEVARFAYEGLERHEDERGTCIAYAPGVMNLVHNSNLLGAVALARSWASGGPETYRDVASASVAWTMAQQSSDGGWPYGVGPKYGWVDNFHTAYCLDSLREIRELLPGTIADESSLSKGFDYWSRTFFRADGAPRYYSDKTYPIDIQCCAQAIETLANWSELSDTSLDLCQRVSEWTIAHMRKHNGTFRYRRNRLLANNLESLHWGESTMLSALGRLQLALNQRGQGRESE